jgi:competence protein ComEC
MFGFVFALISYILGIARYAGLNVRAGVAVIAFVFATLYVLFIGAEMSSVRALFAAACISATVITERVTSFAQRWGVALLAMQLVWPWCVFDIGVILTFAALLGIGLGSEFGRESKLASLLSVTICVWIMTSLVVIVWQGMVSPIGLLLNLVLAAPWSIVNCVGGLLGLGALIVGIPGAAYPMKALAWINSRLADMALVLAESSYGGFKLTGTDRVAVALLVALVAAIIVTRFVRSASSRIRGVSAAPQRWI